MASQKSLKPIRNNPYGYYDEGKHEYVIVRPDTPTPWINYLGAGKYGGIISNTAGGFSFDRDPRNRRVTRYRYNSIPADQPGRYVYLRDQATGEYWSPTWQPVVGCKLDRYECRHGAGYTRIDSEYRGISVSLTYFVPPVLDFEESPVELWVMKIKNIGLQERVLRSFSYIEFSFYDAMIDQQNLDWGGHIVQSNEKYGTIYVTTKFKPTVTFFSSNTAPIGYDTDREEFIGRYRDLANPQVVDTGQPLNSEAPRGNNIGSLCHELRLAPGQDFEITYILGVTDNPGLIDSVISFFKKSKNVKKAYQCMTQDWEDYLNFFKVETPDAEMNAMLNFWNPLQCRTTMYWSRFVSAYESGLGRGMGTRDSAQDILGTVHAAPSFSRDVLSKLWHLQFRDGHTWHQFYPLTGEGGPGLAGEFLDWPQWFCDDHLWLVIAVCAYLKETGDLSFLDERIPYWEGKDHDESVWGHLLRAVDFTYSHRGPHGLPRSGFSDWDDTMNLDHGSGKAESVWCGEQFCRAMLELKELCEFLNRKEDAAHFTALYHEMAGIINGTSWNGDWYVRAYDDDGMAVGVKDEKFHKIGLISQLWAVIGDIGNHERQVCAMESAHEKLNTPYGLALLWPPYNGSDPRVRGTTTYPPGAKENGGIFCHANAWAIVAAAQLGWGDRAYDYYRQILPLARTDADVYYVEPYVYCQNICGPGHPQFGRGRNAWLTGTASWTYVAGMQWILGIRPTYTGLIISPALPTSWQGFKAKRVFRGITYLISVERTVEGVSPSLRVDGKEIFGNIVPFLEKGANQVRVRLTI